MTKEEAYLWAMARREEFPQLTSQEVMELALEQYAISERQRASKETMEEMVEKQKIIACGFAEWLDKSLYTQEEDGLWYNFPTHPQGVNKTTSELYEQFLKKSK